MAVRKPLGKKTRFEVFKRDGFKCMYCGAHPPAVVLEVDHVQAVAEGGLDDMDNLVTACFNCNRGKAANSLNSVPQSLADKAEMVRETEAQLRGFHEVMEAKRDRIEEELWRVAEVLQPGSAENGMKRDWTASIQRFNEALGVHEVLDAAEIATAKCSYLNKAFPYFCGICWNKIRRAGEANA